ncbi:MAG: hypothetical protein M1457_06300 [bacterium]|nr:hypothetical protein [bacterium]
MKIFKCAMAALLAAMTAGCVVYDPGYYPYPPRRVVVEPAPEAVNPPPPPEYRYVVPAPPPAVVIRPYFDFWLGYGYHHGSHHGRYQRHHH